MKNVKKRYILLTIIVLSIAIGFSYDYYIKNEMKNDVYTYLKEEGYRKEDIQKLEVFRAKPQGLTTSVTFTNEPKTRFFYKYDDHMIEPAGYSTPSVEIDYKD